MEPAAVRIGAVGPLMQLLAISTSVENVAVAIGDRSGVVASASARSDRRHAESLVPLIDAVRRHGDIELADLAAIAVDVGPGLFTGLRVGVTTAQSLAWALEIPVIGVGSLDALAQDAPRTDEIVATVLDARRGEVYWSVHRRRHDTVDPVVEPCVSSPDDLVVHLRERSQSVTCVGTGALRYRELLDEVPGVTIDDSRPPWPTASAVLALAAPRAAKEDWVVPGDLAPIYLRAPDAEINWSTRTTRTGR